MTPEIKTVARGDEAVCGRVQDVLPAILPSEQQRHVLPVLAKVCTHWHLRRTYARPTRQHHQLVLCVLAGHCRR